MEVQEMADEEVKNEVQEMNKSFGFETAEGEKIEEVIEEEVKEDEDEVVDDGTEAGSGIEAGEKGEESSGEVEEGEIEEKTPTEEAAEKGTETPEEDDKDKTIAELRRKLDEKEAKEEPEPEPEPEPEQLTFEPQEFLDEDVDLEYLVREPEKLNEVFNKIYQRTITDTRKILGEGILRSIPDIVRTNVEIMNKLNQMNTKFYNDNKDLKPFQKVVAAVFEEVATENPGKDMMELLPIVADESRKRLELHKQTLKSAERKVPKLPSRKRRTTISEEKPNTNPLMDELSEMNKVIRR